MHNNLLASAAYVAALVTVFLLSWQVFAWVIGGAGVLVLLARAYHSQRATQVRAFARRFAAALVLLWCKPRPIDKKLYEFVHPSND